MNTLVLMVLLSTNGINLSWNSEVRAHYTVYSSSSLSSSWTLVTNVSGTGQRMTLALPKNSAAKYYKLTARPNPLAGKPFYLETSTPAMQSLTDLASSDPASVVLLSKIADQPTSIWITSSSSISRIGQVFAKCGDTLPVFTLYNIYQRDNTGGFSSGGAPSPAAYTNFIASCKNALKAKECAVILEPDALAGLGGLGANDQKVRFALLKYAVDELSALTNVHVYIDAGHSAWIQDSVMASRLQQVSVEKASGFALNVSNYRPTSDLVSFGRRVSNLLGGTHFVLDTSRNGKTLVIPSGAYCNLPGAGLGRAPTTTTGYYDVDAFLYIKYPGESDGACHPGDPNAGQWFLSNALMLCTNAVQ